MRTFKDNEGREWTVRVTVDAVKRVRSLCEVDLLAVVSDQGKLLDRLVDDPVLLCDVIYAVCRPEAEKREVSDEAFGRSMAGDAIDVATQSLLEELADFFPSARRTLIHRVVEKLRRYRGKAMEAALGRLDDPALDTELDRLIERQMAPPSDGSSLAAPESSD